MQFIQTRRKSIDEMIIINGEIFRRNGIFEATDEIWAMNSAKFSIPIGFAPRSVSRSSILLLQRLRSAPSAYSAAGDGA